MVWKHGIRSPLVKALSFYGSAQWIKIFSEEVFHEIFMEQKLYDSPKILWNRSYKIISQFWVLKIEFNITFFFQFLKTENANFLIDRGFYQISRKFVFNIQT